MNRLVFDNVIMMYIICYIFIFLFPRKNLGIRREMTVSGLSRLIPTECEVRGYTVLIRAHCTTYIFISDNLW